MGSIVWGEDVAAVYDVTVHYKLATNWSAFQGPSAVSYRGGYMDGAIESIHAPDLPARKGVRRLGFQGFHDSAAGFDGDAKVSTVECDATPSSLR